MKEDSNWWDVVKLVIGVVALCFLVHGGKGKNGGSEDAVKPDTVYTVYTDTIPYYKLVPKDSTVIRYVTAQFPVSVPKTSQNVPDIQDSVGNFSKTVPNVKEVGFPDKDSVTVQIPITQTVYEGSIYTAYVSGYRAKLDSILFRIPRKETTIVKHPKPKRWSVGVQAGYGMGKNGMQPYIGLGVQYRLWEF